MPAYNTARLDKAKLSKPRRVVSVPDRCKHGILDGLCPACEKEQRLSIIPDTTEDTYYARKRQAKGIPRKRMTFDALTDFLDSLDNP